MSLESSEEKRNPNLDSSSKNLSAYINHHHFLKSPTIMHLIKPRCGDFHPRSSFKRNGSSPLLLISRNSFSYDRLPQEPLKLTVLKLDGSSFYVQVAKMATVAELKQAVEDAFSHLPTKGPAMVSWPHVWGNFCLSYDGQKLLVNHDYLNSYKIKDGDQLHFIRHLSINYNLAKTRNRKVVPQIEQLRISGSVEDGEQNIAEDDYTFQNEENSKQQQQQSNTYSTDFSDAKHCEYKMSFLLKGIFSYRRLTNSDTSFNQKNSSSKSKSTTGFFKKIVRFCTKKCNPRKKTHKTR